MYDIFFICYDESNRETNWERLLKFHPNAIKISNIKGIDNAHIMCNQLSKTDKFWTIDGDNWLIDRIEVDPNYLGDLVAFKSIDPIDGYLSTTGGIKLWTKDSFVNKDMSKGDFCKYATKNNLTSPKILSIHKYNVSPFETWKHIFRHMVKCFSGIIRLEDLQMNIDRMERIKSLDQYAYRGYLDAKSYVEECAGDFDKINLINDYDWLKLKGPKEM